MLLTACSGTMPEPGASQLRYAERHGYASALPELETGRHLVLLKCGGCHVLPHLGHYAPEDWPAVMDSMRVDAKLSARQDTLIRAYLMTASGQWRDSLYAQKETAQGRPH